jgi:outer membrane protein TolC
MINKLRRLTWLVAIILSAGSLTAQTRYLPLDEAISLSLQNSNQLKLNKAKIDEANAALRSAQEQRLPTASISGSYLRLNQPTIDLKLKMPENNSGGNTGEGEQEQSSATPTVDQAAYVMANVSVPVFAGFKIQNAIESAKYLERATELDASNNKEEVITNTIEAYSNLFKAKQALDLVRENLRQSEQRVKDFSNLEQNGVLARNDLLKAQLQQSNVELSLLDAENNWKLTTISMNLMLGLPQETELIPDSTAFKAVEDEQTYNYWEGLALSNRKDIQALDYRKKAADAGVKAAKGDYYPSLAVTAGYVAAHIPNLLTITNAINVGVGVSYSPSSLWKTGSKVAEAKARQNQVAVNQDILNDAIRLQVAQAYQNYLSSQKKIDVYTKAIEQATENYKIVKNKYDNALATATELLDADVAQLQAELNYAFAKADAVVAYKKLQQTAGVLADDNHQ